VAGPAKLVIGASGSLGSHVTRQLVERGDTSESCCGAQFYCGELFAWMVSLRVDDVAQEEEL
jgi:nucleoside-diphosphate-sugar epimerase